MKSHDMKKSINMEFIEEWIAENNFSKICEKAEQGDRSCALFINKFINELNMLHFHLHNKSHTRKVSFQIKKIEDLLGNFITPVGN